VRAELNGWCAVRRAWQGCAGWRFSRWPRKRYSLAGARWCGTGASDLAYLAYTMNRRPISLVVAANRATPSGGQRFRTRGIDFHFSSDRGLRLIAWTVGAELCAGFGPGCAPARAKSWSPAQIQMTFIFLLVAAGSVRRSGYCLTGSLPAPALKIPMLRSRNDQIQKVVRKGCRLQSGRVASPEK